MTEGSLALSRLSAHRHALLPAALTVGLAGWLVAAQGGYFPTSWGWAAMPCLLAFAAWLLLSGRAEAGVLDAVFLAALALLVTWIGLSIAWSEVPARSVLELERGIAVLAGVGAFVALARRHDLPNLTTTLLLTVTVVAGYGLATRLVPERLGSFNPIAGYRLAEPVGYWNGLGIFCVLGLLVALAVVSDPRGDWRQAVAAGCVVVLVTTLYFTYSRASWIALVCGLLAAVAMSPARLRLLFDLVITAIPAVLAVVLASRSYALTHQTADLSGATREGHRLALTLAVLAVLAAGLTVTARALAQRVRVPKVACQIVGGTLLAAAALTVVAGLVATGGPRAAVDRARSQFEAPPAGTGTSDLNSRLFSLSGNGRAELWGAAWDTFTLRPVLGDGAGTFERRWQARGDSDQRVRDAHSLYLETLDELGIIGFGLLVAAIAVPLFAGVRARRTAVVPGLIGAFTAFLVHASADWDWELAGVTLTALLIGSLVLVAARTGDVRAVPRTARGGGLALVVLLFGFSLIGLVGNRALANAQSAIESGEVEVAVTQADRARAWMPWSPDPLNARGTASLIGGDRAEARRYFRTAINLDRDNWRSWVNLAVSTSGMEQARALARARSLYPRSTEIDRVAEALAAARDKG